MYFYDENVTQTGCFPFKRKHITWSKDVKGVYECQTALSVFFLALVSHCQDQQPMALHRQHPSCQALSRPISEVNCSGGFCIGRVTCLEGKLKFALHDATIPPPLLSYVWPSLAPTIRLCSPCCLLYFSALLSSATEEIQAEGCVYERIKGNLFLRPLTEPSKWNYRPKNDHTFQEIHRNKKPGSKSRLWIPYRHITQELLFAAKFKYWHFGLVKALDSWSFLTIKYFLTEWMKPSNIPTISRQ